MSTVLFGGDQLLFGGRVAQAQDVADLLKVGGLKGKVLGAVH